jgi:uncharacterized membrane protein YadS
LTSHDTPAPAPPTRPWIRHEDWLAVLLGGLVLFAALAATYLSPSPDQSAELASIDEASADIESLWRIRRAAEKGDDIDRKAAASLGKKIGEKEKELEKLKAGLYRNPLKPIAVKMGEWTANPLDAFTVKEKPIALGLLGTFAIALVLFGLGTLLQGGSLRKFVPAFTVVFLLAVVSYVLAGQSVIKYYNLEYALWAILIGMIISNTIGAPAWLKPAMRTELYIKTGLILLGAEILLSRLLVLGLPGIFVSWVCTPITLIGTYLFGQYVLRIPSKSLNMVISADMSVCGVSAAIATAAACRAKKEELSLAIGISLSFTVLMMIAMPWVIRATGMSPIVGGAWLGGTIDSTGAVAAAGGMLDKTALETAVTVKMIQNILIGVVAFCVAVYWVTYVEKRDDAGSPSAVAKRSGISEIWLRFPKFVLGFIAASLAFSAIYSSGTLGASLAESATKGATETLRGWFFCLAFVSIGLETNFREMGHYMKGGKPLVLYVCGTALNLTLTLAMAWLMFEKVFPQAGAALGN